MPRKFIKCLENYFKIDIQSKITFHFTFSCEISLLSDYSITPLIKCYFILGTVAMGLWKS
jgi:hypothetical protein